VDAEARIDAAVGSVAEEATKLLEALGKSDQEDHVHVPMGEAESCSWCPVCRGVTLLRGASPETLGRLADLATTAATVLADLASRHTESSPAADRAPGDRGPRTEPITVVDEEEPS
jgi:hypothetical protein